MYASFRLWKPICLGTMNFSIFSTTRFNSNENDAVWLKTALLVMFTKVRGQAARCAQSRPMVGYLEVGRDAKQVEDRRGEIGRRHRLLGGISPPTVGSAIDRAAADAAAGQQHRLHVRPVVSAGVLIDLGRPAKLTHAHDERVVEQSAVNQVGEQSRERSVGRRRQPLAQVLEVILVRIPHGGIVRSLVMPVDGHEGNACFKQAPGQQATLTEKVGAICLADAVRFAIQGKGLAHRGRLEQSHAC